MTSALKPVSGFGSTSPSLPCSVSSTTPTDNASLSRRNITDLTFKGKLAMNECHPLSYDKFAQGIIRFDHKDFKCSFLCEDPVNVTCYSEKKVLYSQVLKREAPLEFFMTNLPYGEAIRVRFDQCLGGREINLTVDRTRGLYTLTKEKTSAKFEIKTEDLPASTKFPPTILDTPITTEGGTGLVIHPDKTVSVTDCPKGKMTILNETSRAVVYLLIVAQYVDGEEALVLPFVLDSAKTRELSYVCIHDNWWRAHTHITGHYPPAFDRRPALMITGLQLECFES
jgi:hypothetical protein